MCRSSIFFIKKKQYFKRNWISSVRCCILWKRFLLHNFILNSRSCFVEFWMSFFFFFFSPLTLKTRKKLNHTKIIGHCGKKEKKPSYSESYFSSYVINNFFLSFLSLFFLWKTMGNWRERVLMQTIEILVHPNFSNRIELKMRVKTDFRDSLTKTKSISVSTTTTNGNMLAL